MSDTLVERLRDFAEAYPEDVFAPLPQDKIKAYSDIVTRASAGMGRHFAKFAKEAADEIERLTAERDQWKANHDNQVAIKAAILDRPDLKERAASVQRLTTQLAEAQRNKVEQARHCQELTAQLSEARATWYEKGRRSIKRQNESGCVCVISEDGETIEEMCALHKHAAVVQSKKSFAA